ncbi:hypothetical protein [Antarctobacter heliothermus]|uniref:Uncharacterized protein n=1 Tax=Antarctobacter heliothermus TaxID=74033 RepID=A0A239E4G3_9RHOB|nr:hypothetical protein [Antarctobacter heliothermus]SNS39640.1 hypothetical protein SAMN04488078_101361 [Antarctobacter heliothermus]
MRYVIPLLLLAAPLYAEAPVIEAATAQHGGGGWTVSVTLRHPDNGWDHYADGWRVELPDGTVLATRELLHPHETEQPFTRAQSGIRIPAGTAQVLIRSRCLVDGWSEQTQVLTLP